MVPSYEIIQESLEDLLRDVHHGRIQVPEFQRKLALRDGWITSLLASVSLGYPVGMVQLLQAGDPKLRFDSRPLGTASTPAEPERLLIDGQYRLAALYYVLASGQGVPIDRRRLWYYIDMEAALDPGQDRDETISSVPESPPAKREWERGLFPLRLVFSAPAERVRWRRGFLAHGTTEAREKLLRRFETEVLTAFQRYLVPILVLGKETTRWSVRVHGGADGPALSDRFKARSSSRP